jgi:hypothetical protein
MMKLYNQSIGYFSKHPMANALAHSAGGFGLAIVLQTYMMPDCDAFAPVWVGWVLIVFSVLVHLKSFHGK